NEPLAHEAEEVFLAMNGRGDRSRVTGLLLPGLPIDFGFAGRTDHWLALPIFFADAFPDGFAGGRVETDDAGVGLAANHHNEQAVLQNRRTANAEECWRNGPIGSGVALPDEFAGFQIEANEFSFSAKCITAVVGQQRGTARAIIVAVRIDEVTGIGVAP